MKSNNKTFLRKYGVSRILLLLMFFSFTFLSYGQKTVTGKVTDSKGEALIGVNVKIKNTLQGTITDIDGVFTLPMSNTNQILELSCEITISVRLKNTKTILEIFESIYGIEIKTLNN